MPNYLYKAISNDGRTIKNEIVAPNEDEVIIQLQKLQLVPVEIKRQTAKAVTKKSSKKVKVKEVVLFTKQLFTLLKSGVPILVSLNAIKEQNNDPSFKALVEHIAEEVEQGNSFSEALAQFPKVFPPIYVNSVKVGEMSGTLEETLLYMYKYLEEENEIRQNVKKALRYPILVIFGLIFAFIVFTTFVIPKFIPIFVSSGIELPLPTRLLIGIYHIISEYGIFILFGFVGLVVASVFYTRTENGLYMFHSLLLKLPIFGSLLTKVNISRFAKVFHTMNRTGIPVIKAFETLCETMDNAVYRRELEGILERIKEGSSIANSLRQSPYFSAFVAEMIAIGEKSGALDDMLESVSNYYDLEVSETVKNMTSLIEPIVTVALGGMVLILALAIFLPMWDMMSLVQ